MDLPNLLRYRIKALYDELATYNTEDHVHNNKPTRTQVMKEIERLKNQYYSLTNQAWFNHNKKES